jgi:archaellum component FlaF (FlaF/FlaG flagellin family)
MKSIILIGFLVFAAASRATVKNMNTMIQDAYADQARLYEKVQRLMKADGDLNDQVNIEIQRLNDLSQPSAENKQVKIKLVLAE